MKRRLLISFSGGETSAFMTWIILNEKHFKNLYDEIIVVFVNTGKERDETLKFVDDCDTYFGFKTIWIECVPNPEMGKGVGFRVVDFNSASRNGEPFEALIQKYGIPNVKFPHCTRTLKTHTIRAYARSLGWKNYDTAIGIRIDEIDRISPNRQKERLIYPLVSYRASRRSCVAKFWSEQSFRLQLKSYEGNCDLCFKKSYRKLLTICKEDPTKAEWWKRMEDQYKMFSAGREKVKPPYYFYRNNTSIEKILEASTTNFEPAIDESRYYPAYVQAFLFEMSLDVSNGCTESCEVF